LSTKALKRLKDYIEIALNSKFIDSFNLEHAAGCEKGVFEGTSLN